MKATRRRLANGGNSEARPKPAQAKKPRTADEREKTRLRVQRHRDSQRETDLAAARLAADRAEAIGERAAPSVLREAIIVRGGYMLRGRRIDVVDGRAERTLAIGVDSDPIAKLVRDSKSITERHKRAARLLQQDWQDAAEGVNAAPVDYERAGGGGGDGTGGHSAVLEQVVTRARLEGALAHLGAFTPCVVRVVLHCVPLGIWMFEENVRRGESDHLTPATALAWMVTALDRLAGFYWPKRATFEHLIRHGLMFGPERAEYSMDVESA